MKVQLLYFAGCPNAASARAAVTQALRSTGQVLVAFEEIDVSAPGAPEHLRGWGSPTVLVDGRDVAGCAPTGASCRVYRFEGKTQGWPSEDCIRQALAEGAR